MLSFYSESPRREVKWSDLISGKKWKERESNGFLIPSTMVFIICLDIVQEVEIYLSTALFVLSMVYLGYPRPFAFGDDGILLDGKTIAKDRILRAKKTENGAQISIEWYGWLMKKELPASDVTDSILEEFSD